MKAGLRQQGAPDPVAAPDRKSVIEIWLRTFPEFTSSTPFHFLLRSDSSRKSVRICFLMISNAKAGALSPDKICL